MTSSHIVLLDKAVIAAASWVSVGGEKPFFHREYPVDYYWLTEFPISQPWHILIWGSFLSKRESR